MTRLILDAGHGGSNSPGAVSKDGLREKDLTLQRILNLATSLSEYDCEIVLTRSNDSTVTLQQRVDIANQQKGDFFYSDHSNSSEILTASGFESYISPNAYAKTKEFQKIIHAAQAGVWKGANRADRGMKTASFFVLVKPVCSCILVEHGFLSNLQDVSLLRNAAFNKKINDATVQAFVQCFNLQKKVVIKRLLLNGVQLGAFGTNDALIKAVTQLINENKYPIQIIEIK